MKFAVGSANGFGRADAAKMNRPTPPPRSISRARRWLPSNRPEAGQDRGVAAPRASLRHDRQRAVAAGIGLRRSEPRFRKLESNDAATEAPCAHGQSRESRGQLRTFGVKRSRDYPPESPYPGDVRAQAEQDATELRWRVGLGISPCRTSHCSIGNGRAGLCPPI